MRVLNLAYLNLIRRPVSSLMVALSLGFSVGLGAIMLAFSQNVQDMLAGVDTSVDLILGSKSNSLEILGGGFYATHTQPERISDGIGVTITSTIGSVHVVPICHFAHAGPFPVIGTDRRWHDRPSYASGGRLQQGRWFETPQEAVVGAAVARKLRLRPGDELDAQALPYERGEQPLWSRRLRVSGILDPANRSTDRSILTHYANAHEFHRKAVEAGRFRPFKRGDAVTHLLMFVDPSNPGVEDEIRDVVHEGGAEQVFRVGQEVGILQHFARNAHKATALVAVALVLIASSVAAILFTERFETLKQELALLRSLGYQRLRVACVVLAEAIILSTVGIGAGVCLSAMACAAVERILALPWIEGVSIANPWVAWLCGLTLAACILASVSSLVRLYRWDPHESLKAM